MEEEEAAFVQGAQEQERPVLGPTRVSRYKGISRSGTVGICALLVLYSTLCVLTIAQGSFSNESKATYPRNLLYCQPDGCDAGVPVVNRALRLSASIISLSAIGIIAIVFHLAPDNEWQSTFYLSGAFIITVAAILGFVCFGLDLPQIDNAQKCTTNAVSLESVCLADEAWIFLCVWMDLLLGVIGIPTVACLVYWTSKGTFIREPQKSYGSSRDFKTPIETKGLFRIQVTWAFLLLVGVVAILLLIFTMLLMFQRETVYGSVWDPISEQEDSGWPVLNASLRLTASILGIFCCLANLWPRLPSYYYGLVGFFLVITAALVAVVFALDLRDLLHARNLECPANVKCDYEFYITTLTTDALTLLLTCLYILFEFFIRYMNILAKKEAAKKKAARHADPRHYKDDVTIGTQGQETRSSAQQNHQPYSPPLKSPTPTRPILGIDVVEIEDVSIGATQLQVTGLVAGSAADQAQVMVGDILLRWDGYDINTKELFANAVGWTQMGSTINLEVASPCQDGGIMLRHLMLHIRSVSSSAGQHL